MIYNGTELTCGEEELHEFIKSLSIEVTIHSFDELFTGVEIKNETGSPDALYYVLKINGLTAILQPHDPRNQGFQPITRDNVDEIVREQKNRTVDSMILSKFAKQPPSIEEELANYKARTEAAEAAIMTMMEKMMANKEA